MNTKPIDGNDPKNQLDYQKTNLESTDKKKQFAKKERTGKLQGGIWGNVASAAAGAAVGVGGVVLGGSTPEPLKSDPTPDPELAPELNIVPNPSPEPELVPDSEFVQEPQPIHDDPVNVEAVPVSDGSVDEHAEEIELFEPEPDNSDDDIVDNILSEERIDPGDIDIPNVVNPDDLGMVYTVEGDEYLAASVYDSAGNDFLMIDIDGDGVFDVLVDSSLNVISEVPGELDISDVQQMINPDPEYVEPNVYDENLTVPEQINEDMISIEPAI